MKIAIVSLNQFWEHKLKNKQVCTNYIDVAIAKTCDLIIFPEMTLTGFSMNSSSIAEDLIDSSTLSYFRNESQKGINVVFGLAVKQKGKPANALICLSRSGDVIVEYKKIHPFSHLKENDYYSAGDTLGLGVIDNVKCGFTICYDLRFPEIYQAISEASSVIINIANWPKQRVHHWGSLLTARAIENQIYMIGANRTGLDGNGLQYNKSSTIVDPDGRPVAVVFSFQDMDVYKIEPEMVHEIQSKFPVKRDRKVKLYKALYDRMQQVTTTVRLSQK